VKLWFDHVRRSFVSDDGESVNQLTLVNVDLWTERKVTQKCPQGVIVGFLQGEPAPEMFVVAGPARQIRPGLEGWNMGRPLRRLRWASLVLISGSKCWVADPEETE
jgi:hypothetical protein